MNQKKQIPDSICVVEEFYQSLSKKMCKGDRGSWNMNASIHTHTHTHTRGNAAPDPELALNL